MPKAKAKANSKGKRLRTDTGPGSSFEPTMTRQRAASVPRGGRGQRGGIGPEGGREQPVSPNLRPSNNPVSRLNRISAKLLGHQSWHRGLRHWRQPQPSTSTSSAHARPLTAATGMVACGPSSAGRSPGLYSPEYETMNASVDKAPEPLVSACDPLGAGIAIAVKEKIWSGEYIELASLLKQDMSGKGEFEGGLAGATFSLRPSEFGMGFQIQPQTKNRKIVSVEQWTSAFLVFCFHIHGEAYGTVVGSS